MKTLLMCSPSRINSLEDIDHKKLKQLIPSNTEKVLISKNNISKHPIQEILRDHFEDYCDKNNVDYYKQKVARSIASCKTGELGYSLAFCPKCKRVDMHASACGNRNCPICGDLKRSKWVEDRNAELIPDIPYYHIVFTLPHDLTNIIFLNQEIMLNNLFSAVKDTLLCLCRDQLKMTPSILMILHSFGSNLSLHYHIHTLVSGGGLSLNKKRFIEPKNKEYFLPLDMLTEVYRGKFMDGMKRLKADKKLNFEGSILKYRNSYNWKELINKCYSLEWNIEIKKYSSSETNPDEAPDVENTIEYFSNYTNRSAISEGRITNYDFINDTVSFKYKKYNGPTYENKIMTLDVDEFIRRFLTHILPKGFQRVRSAGFIAGCVRKKNLELIFKQLKRVRTQSAATGKNTVELIELFYGIDVTKCRKCNSTLIMLNRLTDLKKAITLEGT